MKRVVAIVEGYGDVQAVPTLIAKISEATGTPTIAPNPIRAGEWKSLQRPNELERRLELAASRDCEAILIILDLDDGCPVTEAKSANSRIQTWRSAQSVRVEVVFLARGYENLFLLCGARLGENVVSSSLQDPANVRGAKEAVRTMIGRRYRETQDQLMLTRKIDVRHLYSTSRPFKRLCRAVSDKSYAELDDIFT